MAAPAVRRAGAARTATRPAPAPPPVPLAAGNVVPARRETPPAVTAPRAEASAPIRRGPPIPTGASAGSCPRAPIPAIGSDAPSLTGGPPTARAARLSGATGPATTIPAMTGRVPRPPVTTARIRPPRARRPRPPARSGSMVITPSPPRLPIRRAACAACSPPRTRKPDSPTRLKPPWPLAPERTERARLDHLLGRDVVHQGVALLADPLAPPPLAQMLDRPGPVLVLDQVTDPRNVGAILRSAAAFGAAGVITQDRNAPEETGSLAKAASGALETVPLLRAVNIARTLVALKAADRWVVGLDAAGPVPLDGPALAGRKLALVLGAEGEGLRRLTRETCDLLARWPCHRGRRWKA